MLGRLRMNVDECIREYLLLGEKVFSEPRSLPNEYMFDGTKLENAVKKVLREKLGEGREDEPLSDPLGNEGCKTYVPSVRRRYVLMSLAWCSLCHTKRLLRPSQQRCDRTPANMHQDPSHTLSGRQLGLPQPPPRSLHLSKQELLPI